jgi:hypothetical protein
VKQNETQIYEGRTGFSVHQWVLIRRLDEQKKIRYLAVDACSGPVARPIPIEEYLNITIDTFTFDFFNTRWPSWNILDLKICHAVESLLEEEEYAQTDNLLPLFDLFEKSQARRHDPPPMAVPVLQINEVIQTAMAEAEPRKAYVVTTNDWLFTMGKTHLEIEVCEAGADEDSQNYLTVRVEVSRNFREAIASTHYYLNRTTLGERVGLRIPSEDEGYYGDLYFTSEPHVDKYAMIYGNIACVLSGESVPYPTVQTVYKALARFMRQFEDVLPKPVEDFYINCPGTVQAGNTFYITASTIGIAAMHTHAPEDNVFIGDISYLESQDEWEMECIAGVDSTNQEVPRPVGTLVKCFPSRLSMMIPTIQEGMT